MELQQSQPAFTMIELIFVIVIIGILSGIAMAKFFAIRNDAKITTDIAYMSACIHDVGMYYTARVEDIKKGDSVNCDSVKCYDITFGHNGGGFTVKTNTTAADYCKKINDLGGNLAGVYDFNGSHLVL